MRKPIYQYPAGNPWTKRQGHLTVHTVLGENIKSRTSDADEGLIGRVGSRQETIYGRPSGKLSNFKTL